MELWVNQVHNQLSSLVLAAFCTIQSGVSRLGSPNWLHSQSSLLTILIITATFLIILNHHCHLSFLIILNCHCHPFIQPGTRG